MAKKLIGAFLCFVSTLCFGTNEAIVWDGNYESISIGNQVSVLKDAKNSYTIKELKTFQSKDLFTQHKKNVLVFNDANHYWINFRINNSTTEQLVLELAQPVLKDVELYYKDSNTNKWQMLHSGYTEQLNTKLFNHPYQVFQLLEGEHEYFVKFQSNSFSIPLRIWEENNYGEKVMTERMVFGIFTGLMLFVVLINVFFFFSFKKWPYMHYAIMVALFYFIAANVEGYMLLLAPNLDLLYGLALFSLINMPIGTSYGLIFLEAKKYTPKVYKLGLALIAYYLSFVIWHIFLDPLPLHVITSIGGLLNVAFTVFLAFSTWKKGSKTGYYYFIIYTVFFAIALIDSINRFTGYPPSFYEITYISIGFLFEAFALSFLLTKRFEWERKEMTDAKAEADRKLLTQVMENERIVKDQNTMLEKKVEERTHELSKEKQKSDELLLNILPLEVAEEIKSTGKFKTRKYESISVLFVDIVGFTKLSEKETEERIVNELDSCFREFDRITKKYNLEKIKTIGDCYMCAGGLPLEYPTHAIQIVRAALEIVDYMERNKIEKQQQKLPYFEIRAGINSGPVIAGIVGSDKFAYDIWGDTVNTASRMEQNSQTNRVNISKSTYELVKNQFEVEYRGKIEAKNKGEIDMYFIVSEKKKTSIKSNMIS